MIYIPSKKLILDYLSSNANASLRFAASFRRLRRDYTGPLINVRRPSDNVQRNIYGKNYVDPVDLVSFASGQLPTLYAIYDQSINGNHATQSTAANQPTVYPSANLSTPFYFRYGGLSLNFQIVVPVYSANAVIQPVANDVGFIMSSNSSNSQNMRIDNLYNWFYNYLQGNQSYTTYSVGTSIMNSTFVRRAADLTSIDVYKNGSMIGTNTGNTTNSAIFDSINSLLGTIQGQSYYYELLFFSTALSNQDRQILEHDQEHFYQIAGV